MASEKIIQIIETLNKATKEGRLHWVQTAGEESFRVTLGLAVLELEKETSPAYFKHLERKLRQHSYVIYIKDATGEKILEIEFFDPENDKYNLVKELYEEARNNALNLDQILDSIIANVNSGT